MAPQPELRRLRKVQVAENLGARCCLSTRCRDSVVISLLALGLHSQKKLLILKVDNAALIHLAWVIQLQQS